MATDHARGPVDGSLDLSADAVRHELRKVLNSRRFARSERMRRFLRFVVEKAVNEESDQLKEHVIAIEVFDKGDDFDARMDSVVRVEARRLRTQLRDYYEDEGREDSLRIDVPTGAYVPTFQKRDTQPEDSTPEGVEFQQAIVVLPFVDMSPAGDSEYLCDGITEQLTAALAQIPGVQVVARTSAFAFKGKHQDIRVIGRQLGVATAVEGSVQVAGSRLRITAQLVSAKDGCHLWSESYDRELKDAFEIQDDITRAVVNSLRGRLARKGGESQFTARGTSLKSNRNYLKGRHYWQQQTEEALKKAVWYFERAIAEDPEHAAAYVGLSHCYRLLGFWCMLYPGEALRKSKAAALKALEIDDRLGEAHAALAGARALFDWKWSEADREYRRALELDPDSPLTLQSYAMVCLLPARRVADAVTQLTRAVELDPLSILRNTMLGWAYHFAREYDRAIEQFQRTFLLEPNFHLTHVGLGWAFEQKAMFDEAIQAFQKATELSSRDSLSKGSLGHAYGKAGRAAEARSVLHELEDLSHSRTILATDSAVVCLGLGEMEQALAWLEKARDEHCGRLCLLPADPRFDPLRKNRRFKDLLTSIGLDADHRP